MQTDADEILCVFNASAGSSSGADHNNRLTQLFAEQGRKVRLVPLSDGTEVTRLVKSAIGASCKLVLAAGGDGTINAVANLLVDTQTALGVIPLGTLNHFAKDLQIPPNLEEAIATAFDGIVDRVDVGEVNGRIFLNNSSIGLYPGIVQQRDALRRKGQGKWAAFMQALMFSLWRYSEVAVRMKTDGEQVADTRTPFVFVGNNRYEFSAPHVGERHSLTGGFLWICQAPHAGRLGLLGWALRALVGRKQTKGPVLFEARNLSIQSTVRQVSVATDGEVNRMVVPLSYRIKPRALCVMVPAGSSKESGFSQ